MTYSYFSQFYLGFDETPVKSTMSVSILEIVSKTPLLRMKMLLQHLNITYHADDFQGDNFLCLHQYQLFLSI